MNAQCKKVQKQLIEKYKKKGIYENFGQNEVRKLLDNPNCEPYGNDKERQFYNSVMTLENWAINFNG